MSGMTNQKVKKQSISEFIKKQILDYSTTKKNVDAVKKAFDETKFEFNQLMDKYFSDYCDENNKIVIEPKEVNEYIGEVKTITLTKVTPTTVDLDVDRFKSVVKGSLRKSVIRKKYEVNNWQGLFNLLKSSGVDFKEFKKYVNMTEVIDYKALDKAVELGEIDIDDVKKCSIVKVRSSYYKLTEK